MASVTKPNAMSREDDRSADCWRVAAENSWNNASPLPVTLFLPDTVQIHRTLARRWRYDTLPCNTHVEHATVTEVSRTSSSASEQYTASLSSSSVLSIASQM